MATLASVADLADRVGEEIVHNADVAMANSFLRLVSAQVRHYGADWDDIVLAPEIAIAITIEAAARGYLNPEGWLIERGDELTLSRHDIFSRGMALTPTEVIAIRQAAGRFGLSSVLTTRDVTVAQDLTLHSDKVVKTVV